MAVAVSRATGVDVASLVASLVGSLVASVVALLVAVGGTVDVGGSSVGGCVGTNVAVASIGFGAFTRQLPQDSCHFL